MRETKTIAKPRKNAGKKNKERIKQQQNEINSYVKQILDDASDKPELHSSFSSWSSFSSYSSRA